MSRKISVIIKEPGKNPRHVNVSNSLENLQRTVGGNIETVTVSSDLVVIFNDEGRLRGLPMCCNICGVNFVGTIIFVGIEGDDFADIPCDFQTFKRMFPMLWGARRG